MRTGTDSIHRHIGDRLRVLRENRGFSQTDLGDVLGVSFQQMGNYEKGKHRLSAGALYLLSRFLRVNLGDFFEGLTFPETGFAEDGATYTAEIEEQSQSDRLDAAFGRIRSQRDRALAVAIVETIARYDDGAA